VSGAGKLMNVTHKQQVTAFLQSQSTLALATTSADGAPCGAPLFYLADDCSRLYWLSSASARHSRNLKRNPRAAISVYCQTAAWREIQGVQMEGRVDVVAAPGERRRIVEAYCARFHLEPLFVDAIARSRLYRFQPEWIRYLDNTRRFGYKFEITIAASAG
jgi:uncharacterized protein YhbP (UPF0306 family)